MKLLPGVVVVVIAAAATVVVAAVLVLSLVFLHTVFYCPNSNVPTRTIPQIPTIMSYASRE